MKIYLFLALALLRKASSVSSQCEELISCLDKITGKSLFDLVPPEASRDDLCVTMVNIYQGQTGIDAMCAAAAAASGRLLASTTSDSKYLRVNEIKESTPSQSRQESTFPGYGRHLAAPTCQASFSPEFADDSGSGTSYDTLMAAVEGPYLFGGKKKRSDGDAYAALFIGYLTALNAAAAATGIPVADNLAQISLSATQSTVESLNVHDGGIDSTEIQAAFENSQKILTQTCNIISQVNTFETTATTRFGNIDAAISSFQATVNTRFNTVDASITTLTNNVAIGFDTTYARFDSVDSDLDTLSSAVSTGFTDVYERFDQVEALVNSRLDAIEATLEARFTQLDDLLAIVRTLLITPDGRRTAWNNPALICDGSPTGNCATVPNFP
ncbi:hypothetical protein FisN_4Hh434 [Fistulifera solaris]|uniref:Uncharacterized protein n=1 Tax=Fistulifera solaris TaxID=1519565 RepID=A0A1Z5KID4_FISSO|nr:hypothetical protein FisN_4Hh434 [Fistulifera solaris]|eukprot:GAX26063.1 hypothetical protein FisN_4Hh434 [Fistulifera solaris]